MNGSVWAPVLVAIIVAVIGPMLINAMNNRQRREERQEDKRQRDEVAQRLVKMDNKVGGKLDVIHTLVDGSMTAAMHSELNATVRELAMMNEVIDLKRANGHEPTQETLTTLEATQTKIDDLYMSLSARERQVELSEQQERENQESRNGSKNDRRK